MCWWSPTLEILRISATLPVSASASPYIVHFAVISECITAFLFSFIFPACSGFTFRESSLVNQICHLSEEKKNKNQ